MWVGVIKKETETPQVAPPFAPKSHWICLHEKSQWSHVRVVPFGHSNTMPLWVCVCLCVWEWNSKKSLHFGNCFPFSNFPISASSFSFSRTLTLSLFLSGLIFLWAQCRRGEGERGSTLHFPIPLSHTLIHTISLTLSFAPSCSHTQGPSFFPIVPSQTWLPCMCVRVSHTLTILQSQANSFIPSLFLLLNKPMASSLCLSPKSLWGKNAAPRFFFSASHLQHQQQASEWATKTGTRHGRLPRENFKFFNPFSLSFSFQPSRLIFISFLSPSLLPYPHPSLGFRVSLFFFMNLTPDSILLSLLCSTAMSFSLSLLPLAPLSSFWKAERHRKRKLEGGN